MTVAGPVAHAGSVASIGGGEVVLCDGDRCQGTDGADHHRGLQPAPARHRGAGDDQIELDLLFLQGSSDIGAGGPGRDCIDGGGSNDQMFGGPGDDNVPCVFTLIVNPLAA